MCACLFFLIIPSAHIVIEILYMFKCLIFAGLFSGPYILKVYQVHCWDVFIREFDRLCETVLMFLKSFINMPARNEKSES